MKSSLTGSRSNDHRNGSGQKYMYFVQSNTKRLDAQQKSMNTGVSSSSSGGSVSYKKTALSMSRSAGPDFFRTPRNNNNKECIGYYNDNNNNRCTFTEIDKNNNFHNNYYTDNSNNNDNSSDKNNDNNTDNNDNNNSRMLGNSIVKKPYAVDDLYIKSEPKKLNQQNTTRQQPASNSNNDNIFQTDYVNRYLTGNNTTPSARKNLALDLRSQVDQQTRKYEITVTKPTAKPRTAFTPPFLEEEEDEDEYISVSEIRSRVEAIIKATLNDELFDEMKVTRWCKDISNTCRDQIKTLTESNRKVIATTYIGPKSTESGVHVSINCQTHINSDDFITVAFEGENFFVWVSLLLADY